MITQINEIKESGECKIGCDSIMHGMAGNLSGLSVRSVCIELPPWDKDILPMYSANARLPAVV
jgi:hypothetical protein